MRFDAHQHFWNPDRLHYPILNPEAFGRLYRVVEPPELEPMLKRAGIDGTVAVQAKDGCDETAYLLELSDRFDWIAGVVGWVDLANPAAAGKQLERFTRHPKFKGVRHLIMVDSDPDWLIRPEVLKGLKLLAEFGVSFDVGAEFPQHLRHLPVIADKVPELRLVIDHLAKPPADKEGLKRWAAEIRLASRYPQIFAKISGMNPDVDNRSIVKVAYDAFGANRLMFGSDWPLAERSGGYERIWRVVNEVVDSWPEEDRNTLFGRTAHFFYRL
jgi:L-fuconolactonase